MADYTISPYEEISNENYKFYLVFEDGKSHYKDFVDNLTQKEDIEGLSIIFATMQVFGNKDIKFTKKKFRPILTKQKGRRRDISEFKGNKIRIYVIITDDAIYILFGGFKKDQDNDLVKINKHFKTFDHQSFNQSED